MYQIGDLVKKFKLSRSTILYYDKLGLLKPTKRAENKYRFYDVQEVIKLSKILMYRESGISLRNIQKLLDIGNNETTGIVMERLYKIQMEIKDLKEQENLILAILREEVIIGKNTSFTSKTWTQMLINLGYEEKDWLNWHLEFELDSPEDHYKFLKSLNMTDQEIQNLLMLIKDETNL
jgi:DNA-binding transcriptional MerR regulator